MHVLSVGASVMDLFVDIDPDHVKTVDQTVSFELGDKIPSEIKKTAIGGNGANVAVGLTRLEIPVTFYTYLGADFFSREIQEGLSSEGLELEIERHNDKFSPLHIILDFPTDRVILANYSKNPHDFNPKGNKFDYVFLTSIPETWENAYRKVLAYAKVNNISIAFSPGTRQIEDRSEVTLGVVKNSKIYFSNKEEAEKILDTRYEILDTRKLLQDLKRLGPEIVSITDGPKGAYAIDASNNCYYIEPAPTEGHEKTGAGDAYATGFLAAVLSGHDVPTAMKWGCLNSGGVMQHVGAQTGLLSRKQLDEELRKHDNLKAVAI